MGEENQEINEESVVVKKNHIFAVVGVIALIAFFAFAAQAMVIPQNGGTITGNAAVPAGPTAPIQGGKQVVQITAQGTQYLPNPVKLKKGVPTVFEVDLNTVRGCLRGIQIPAFNVKKLVSATDNKIEFTPDKAGTFSFTCFMGMGRGQIVVTDENGNVPQTADVAAAQAPAGGSCGSGGCGCGGY